MLRRTSLTVSGLIFAFALAITGTAGAATNLGATFAPGSCPSSTTFIQTVSPGNAYTVPFNGVITRWSYQSAAPQANSVKLKVGRVPPGTDLSTFASITIVGESASQSPGPDALNTYPTRIPVQAGDLIGEYLTGAATDCSRIIGPFILHYDFTDVSPGSSDMFTPDTNKQLDIAAVLEPDADHDGFGDETQDQCPNNASTQGPCPRTGQRTAALKKCKRKHSARARRKCRQKASLLPL